ncbi:transglutaminase family protein [Cyanobium sp. Morenito 9A2]|uniref:transglutaminase family protein n=1 Tax=Cyanobium sp. Morenito 9A2 TaxID=2823718 RepID=UPI0020CBF113|nr:transglutaminase family protein [Cyanobium sp. Morenito 9A2]MCP9850971.1 transglutaminase family protein [Cyanobium sp. Morenito 9A2]
MTSPPWLAGSLAVAREIDRRLSAAGVQLTLGGEPTYVPNRPEGAEWSVAADGPTKLGYAKALGQELQRRVWPESTLIYCPGKRYDGEVNPRWALRLIIGANGKPIVRWPQDGGSEDDATAPGPLLEADALTFLESIGTALGCGLRPLALRDTLDPDRRVWAAPLCHHDLELDPEAPPGWEASEWPLDDSLRELLPAAGPAGLRLPLQHFPEGVLRQVLTLEVHPGGWSLFLPPLAREPLEQLLRLIAAASAGHSQPALSGVLPLDITGHWQVLGLTADPGVLEVNLPVCANWEAYAGWMAELEAAGATVGLRSWKDDEGHVVSTGGGNHLLWGGPDLETNPFFSRPRWLVGVLRFWQRHPSLAYLFSSPSVGPASQAPRPDEGSASWLDLELAHGVLETLPEGDQRVLISETLRHLHADRSGNTHRSEISLDKFWNPAWAAGCQGLIEFRAIETLPTAEAMATIALLWSALAVHLLEPRNRPEAMQPFGPRLHDETMLPSALLADLEGLLARLAADGLRLDPKPFRTIWESHCPRLLAWQQGAATLEIRRAREAWPLLCDTPVEGGSTSRFVDSSLRRFELISNGAFRERFGVVLNGRPLHLGAGPVAVRYRQDQLYPCLHPAIAPHLPLALSILDTATTTLAGHWTLTCERDGFKSAAIADPAIAIPWLSAAPWRVANPGEVTVDLRLEPLPG